MLLQCRAVLKINPLLSYPSSPRKKKSQGGTGSSEVKYTWENRCGKTKPIAFHEELPKITLARQACDLQRSLLLEWVRMVIPFLPLQWTGNTFSLSTKFSCTGPLTLDYITGICRCWDKVERVQWFPLVWGAELNWAKPKRSSRSVFKTQIPVYLEWGATRAEGSYLKFPFP